MKVKPGMRLRSAVCETEVVVVHAGDADVDVHCGGHAMLPVPGEGAPVGLTVTQGGGTLIGKRYLHEASGTELLCTKAGQGALTVEGEHVPVKAAKALPASD